MYIYMYVCMYVCMYAIVSITGIEIFDSSGHLIKLSNPDMQVDSNVCMYVWSHANTVSTCPLLAVIVADLGPSGRHKHFA